MIRKTSDPEHLDAYTDAGRLEWRLDQRKDDLGWSNSQQGQQHCENSRTVTNVRRYRAEIIQRQECGLV